MQTAYASHTHAPGMTVNVAVLGATGAVGQRFIQLLADHPQFALTDLTASASSAGKSYAEAATWRLSTPLPAGTAELPVVETDPAAVSDDAELVFSALPSAVASSVEPAFAEAGYVVSSNASNDRMAPDVPLVIPEVNPSHLGLLDVQRDARQTAGVILKNPNCSTITMVPTLAAVRDAGLERVHVVTLQAVSGAGYGGVTSMQILDNVIPHISGEGPKMEAESAKLLGTLDGDAVVPHPMTVSASTNRVPTIDGHLETVFIETSEPLDTEATAAAMQLFPSADLHSSPDPVITVFDAMDRPQPRLDRMRGGGMQVSVGGITGTKTGMMYNCLAHNTIRGAAGASILNGELLLQAGYL